MEQKLIDEKFNAFLWKMSAVEEISPSMEVKLKIAFQEGLIIGLSELKDVAQALEKKIFG